VIEHVCTYTHVDVITAMYIHTEGVIALTFIYTCVHTHVYA
jgi:hypothetical protein